MTALLRPTGSGTATVTLTGTGSCTVPASQAGNTDYTPAPPLTQTYTATPGAQADLRITVTPGPTTRAAGPLTLTITGPRDSGATRTQLVTNLPVTNPFNNFTVGGYLIR